MSQRCQLGIGKRADYENLDSGVSFGYIDNIRIHSLSNSLPLVGAVALRIERWTCDQQIVAKAA